jgi:outer membrane protein assembly factor BamD (BamD/ComL family)
MNRILLYGLICLTAAFGASAQETNGVPKSVADKAEKTALAALDRGQVQEAADLLSQISNPAARLCIQAAVQRAQGNLKEAVQTAAKAVALHSGERIWMARIELMIAELYLELGMPESAEVTARQVQVLYEGLGVEEDAGAVRSEVEKLKEVSE